MASKLIEDIEKASKLPITTDSITNKNISTIKTFLHKEFISDWNIKVNSQEMCPKLRTYSLFKKDFKLEPYIKLHHPIYRKLITKLRVSWHNLTIETGRYHKPKLTIHECICLLCNDNKVGDEIHYITDCTALTNHRKMLFSTVNKHITIADKNSVEIFKSILSSQNVEITIALGKFLKALDSCLALLE